ncbi:anchored repeat ABC transporter, substrate-binding protein [Arcanobacterium wilhelmae]|uniref:anchored repeat ABC transporter, substrate-binding protein n=1 Tax=Arcanobacterium wilhelmae TaxID=1803177 RepID=UPI002414EE66|nr:anchored repeat ABC transporter, substrate-binding protein [Arcanobacterium wilhelmae]WFN89943.1 anchored repeat ABC transporter, substrate-binding protein [Arcanobacterium wilhelmae]
MHLPRSVTAALGKLTALASLSALAACAPASAAENDGLVIVASTPIMADFVRNVAPNATVETLVPMGADPHTYEPSMAALRDIARADIAFSNGLLLEAQALTHTIDSNLPDGAKNVALGSESVKFGARQIPLVENASLATVWLGLRVDGQGGSQDYVTINATKADGPGTISAFTTGTFGEPTAWMNSGDGIDPAKDTVKLPTNAHTHMSWGFSKQGIYTLSLEAVLHSGTAEKALGNATLTFAVGIDPHEAGKTVIDTGHQDITAHLDGGMTLYGDTPAGTGNREIADVVIAVPNSTTTIVPDNRWNFLGHPGAEAWILAQAVIGQHVHGEIDPHMWHDVRNAIAYTETIADELGRIDPKNAASYSKNAAAYSKKLENLDEWTRAVLTSIPASQRTLVTAHDSFGYLAKAYGMTIAGFVAPNPSLEPSVQQLTNLTRTLEALPAPGVFVEPTSSSHLKELVGIAHSTRKELCNIYSDTLTPEVPTYEALVEYNVKSLKSCLDPASLPAWEPAAQHTIPNPSTQTETK